MIITFIAVGLLVASICFFHIESRSDSYNVGLLITGAALLFVSIFSILFIGIDIVTTNVNWDTDYQNMLYEREVLEYRIEHVEDNIVGNEMLYNDIIEFNNELRIEKRFVNNPWTNWFYNQDIAEIDYVELE